MTAWKTYLWLTFVGLCASAVNWPQVIYDGNGKLRWGVLAMQIPIAFSIGVMSHDLLMPLAKYAISLAMLAAVFLAGVGVGNVRATRHFVEDVQKRADAQFAAATYTAA